MLHVNALSRAVAVLRTNIVDGGLGMDILNRSWEEIGREKRREC